MDTAIRCEIDNEDLKVICISFKQFIVGDRDVQHLWGLVGRERDLIWTRSEVINWKRAETQYENDTSQNLDS